MTENKLSRAKYIVPLADTSTILPDLLCDSVVGGDLEDLTQEDWTI